MLTPGDGLGYLDRHVGIIGRVVRIRAKILYLVAAVTQVLSQHILEPEGRVVRPNRYARHVLGDLLVLPLPARDGAVNRPTKPGPMH